MDRRQQKTRKAVFDALGRLLKTKAFYDITVQDILDEANIGRSTYYDHFQSREDLLKAMCDDLFVHIAEGAQEHEGDIEGLFHHVLEHLGDEEDALFTVLRTSSRQLLLDRLYEELLPVIDRMTGDGFRSKVVTAAFIGLADWWVDNCESCTAGQAVERLSAVVQF